MTAVPPSVFNNADVRLRVWFNDGVNGSQKLVPDQRITAVGYAVIAGNVPDGAVTGAKHSFDQFPPPERYRELMDGFAREGAKPT